MGGLNISPLRGFVIFCLHWANNKLCRSKAQITTLKYDSQVKALFFRNYYTDWTSTIVQTSLSFVWTMYL